MNHLHIRNLSKTYRNGVRALQDISLDISNGIFGLLGPNGAGKSTLMRSIAALQEPDHGQIIFNDKDIVAHPQYIRQQLGYLPQEFGVYPGLSAFHLMDHLAILKGITKKQERYEQVNALLQQTNLYMQKNRAVSTFSGGMKQRFGIAQALLGNPQLLIVDEPTAGLDPQERNRFLDLLSEVGEQKIVILSTHIVEDVRDMCQRLAIIHEGRLVRHGVPSDLIKELQTKVWQKTLPKEASNQLQSSFNILSTRLLAGQRRIRIWSEQLPGEGFESIEPDLEDVYFSTFSAKKGS
ncbi:MAG: multidrug ABC transporter ATP-binding protein [Saprospiraceae bacterium]|nr:MAG: multidrug ABC transporter ATP-binding protein [Saprospiraceae bacterium]